LGSEGERTDSLSDTLSSDFVFSTDRGLVFTSQYKDLRTVDSLHYEATGDNRLGWLEYRQHRKAIELRKYDGFELLEKFGEAQYRNFAKALFLYMPLFALVIWLFHGKKRWLYFDHGIFTLHYFSFVLLAFVLAHTLSFIINLISPQEDITVAFFLYLGMALWYIIHFFVAHYRMYRESLVISSIKSVFIYLINTTLMILLLTGLSLLTVFMIN
jgi:hypothetical protein